MSLKHGDIWRAIDKLAERHGTSPSGLARKAGLSSTIFNVSKRNAASRKRWPSTESIAQILQATDTNLDDFVALASPSGDMPRRNLPMIGLDVIVKDGIFDDTGYPAGKNWDEIVCPVIADARAFAVEIKGKSVEPVYREGDRIIVSPHENPRRGDRVVARTVTQTIHIGLLGRESARTVEIIPMTVGVPALVFATEAVEWMYRIVWASQ